MPAKKTGRNGRLSLGEGSPALLSPPKGALARAFHEWIKAKGFRSLPDVAQATGFSTHHVRMLRRGKRVPKPGSAGRTMLEAMIAGRMDPPHLGDVLARYKAEDAAKAAAAQEAAAPVQAA